MQETRFNGVVLEHWWQVFQGYSKWLSPSYFTTEGVLGYSDADFLFALPYEYCIFDWIYLHLYK
jgi:hypothetical protein